MLIRYLTSPDCSYVLPASLDAYLKCTDYSLYEHLAAVANPWAQRIALRRPYRMLIELHATEPTPRPATMQAALEAEGIDVILASSHTRLSKYHATQAQQTFPIFVVDQYDPTGKPVPIEQCTRIFQRYEETRMIERLYVAPELHTQARRILVDQKL
jgi:endonuclease/exonuclease/phosphatase family metal-dependent hydrolase